MEYQNMSATTARAQGRGVYKRFEALIGGGVSQRVLLDRISYALGLNQSTVFRWITRGFPAYAEVILEFMETTDRAGWPARVRSAAGIGGDFPLPPRPEAEAPEPEAKPESRRGRQAKFKPRNRRALLAEAAK